MTTDLFHDVARAYYGVGPEVYTLANIATHGNAPAGYALGCESGAPEQYAGEDAGPTSRDYELLADYNELAPDLVQAAKMLSERGLHDEAAKAHGSLARFFSDLSQNSNYAPASKLATYHEGQRDHHLASAKPPKGSSRAGSYVSPGIPAPPKQPKSMPGQKSLFACSQPYALGDARTTGTGTADDDPQMKRKSADGMYPAQARPVSQSGQRITLPGDYNPENADEEDYGIMDAAKKAALGAGIAMSAMGGGCAKSESAATPTADSSGFTDSAQTNVQTRLGHARDRAARMKVRQTTGGGPGVGVSTKAPKIDYSLTGTGTKVKVPESKNCAKSGCGKSK